MNEELCFCDVPTALVQIRAGRVLAIVDDESSNHAGALVMASAEPSPDTVRMMVSATGGFVCMAVSEADLRQVKLPESIETDFVLGAVFPKALERDCSEKYSGHSYFKHQIIPFTTRKSGVLRHPRPAECIADLAELAGGGLHCFVSTFSDDRRASAVAPLCNAVKTYSLHVLRISELIRYRLTREDHVRSRSSVPVKSRFGDFQFRRIESDVFDHCGVLIKGDQHEFRRRPPLARIEKLPKVGGVCTCLPKCMDKSFTDTIELIHKDGYGIVVFMPSMRDFSAEEFLESYTLDFLKDDPFSTLDDSVFQRVTSAGVCAQILNHLGAKCVRIVSDRPQRVKDLESFGIEIVEEIGINKNRLGIAMSR